MKSSTINTLRIIFGILSLLSVIGLLIVFNLYTMFIMGYAIGTIILVTTFVIFSIWDANRVRKDVLKTIKNNKRL